MTKSSPKALRSTRRYPKLTEKEVAYIIERLEQGATANLMAEEMGVDKRLIRGIKYRKLWDYMPRTVDFGSPQSVSRFKISKESCEGIWHGYYTEGLSAQALADRYQITRNVVRQILTRGTHKEHTKDLVEAFPENGRTNRKESPLKIKDQDVACMSCQKLFKPGNKRRKTCSKDCLSQVKRAIIAARYPKKAPEAEELQPQILQVP